MFSASPCAMTLHYAHNCAVKWGGRAGATGGYVDMYTQKYTDQVNWVLTTLHIWWFTLTCDHKTKITPYCDHILYVTVCNNIIVCVDLGLTGICICVKLYITKLR